MVKDKRVGFVIIVVIIIVLIFTHNYFGKTIVDFTEKFEVGELYFSYSNAFLSCHNDDLHFNTDFLGLKTSEKINKRSFPIFVLDFPKSDLHNSAISFDLRVNEQYRGNTNLFDLYRVDSITAEEMCVAKEIEDYCVYGEKIYTLSISEHKVIDGAVVYSNQIKEYSSTNYDLISTTEIPFEKHFENIMVKNNYAVFTINRRELYCYSFNSGKIDRVIPDYAEQKIFTLFNSLYVTDENLYFCYCLAKFDGPDLNTIKDFGLCRYNMSDKTITQISERDFDAIHIFDDKYIWAIDGFKLYRINNDTLAIERIR